jgi:RNA polymerase sigma factor (sigma-70 family)
MGECLVNGDRPSPAELLAAVAEHGDRHAFDALFAFYAPRINSYLLRSGADPATAEELVQDIMLTVWRRAGEFDHRQAGVSTWIFTIARNRRIDQLRRDRYWRSPSLAADAEPAPAAPTDALFEAREASMLLREAIGALPPEQAELLRLAFFNDKSHGAIARERGMPLGTVKSRLRLALRRLRQFLEAHE